MASTKSEKSSASPYLLCRDCALSDPRAKETKRRDDFIADISSSKVKVNSVIDIIIAALNSARESTLAQIDEKARQAGDDLESDRKRVAGISSRSHSCELVGARLLEHGSGSEIFELSPVSGMFWIEIMLCNSRVIVFVGSIVVVVAVVAAAVVVVVVVVLCELLAVATNYQICS